MSIVTCKWCKRKWEWEMWSFPDHNTNFCSKRCEQECQNVNASNSPSAPSGGGSSSSSDFGGGAATIGFLLFIGLGYLAATGHHSTPTAPSKPPEAVAIDPRYQEDMEAGYALTEEKSYQAALEKFQHALRIKPGDSYASKAIANVKSYIAQNLYQQAMEKGYALSAESNKAQEAIASFEQALAALPNDSNAKQAISNILSNKFTQLGTKLMNTGDAQGALLSFDIALQNHPNDESTKSALKQAAIQTTTTLLKPEFQPANLAKDSLYGDHMTLATQLEKQQDYSNALMAYDKALVDRPNDAKAKEAIRRVALEISHNQLQR